MRYYHERRAAELLAGQPTRKEISNNARKRMVREIEARAFVFDPIGADDLPAAMA
ncbi:MAG TPA: hypothetical protein VIX73_26455 [Kofleriaceae bacterium]